MDTSLLWELLFGAPVLALALTARYHARLYARRGGFGAPPAGRAAEAEAASSGPPAEVVLDLRRSIDEMLSQLTRQGDALSNLLSESARRAARRELECAPPARPKRAESPPPAAVAPDLVFTGADLPRAVQQVTAEGLSDRAIARRLRIGLEDVQLLGRRRPAPRS